MQRSRGGRRPESGHTLIELVVAGAVVAIIGSLLAAVMGILVRFNSRGASDVETERLARLTLAHLAQELREASAEPGALAMWHWDEGEGIRVLGFASARQEAAGRAFAADLDGRPQWRTAVYYVHDRSTATLRRIGRPWTGSLAEPETSDGRLAARGVQRLTVSRAGELITIALDIHAGARPIHVQTTVRPRN
jgi:type II secretory pathway pseudopilin PulG